MNEAEMDAARDELTSTFVRSFAKYPPEHTRGLAILCLGSLLGSSYATDVERYGRESARDFAAAVFQMATLCANASGIDPDFKFAIIEKSR
jgi:hypothetical protein